MDLYNKIIKIYPELTNYSFVNQDIILQNDSDGKGDYIAKWNHPTFSRPTQEQIDSITG